MRLTVVLVAFVLALVAATAATANPPTTESDSFAYGPFVQDCGSFLIEYSGVTEARVTTYLDQDGNPIRLVAHVQIRETDGNTSTGRTIELRGNFTDVFDLVAGTETINGQVFMSNDPGSGSVLQDTGKISFNSDGTVVIHGPHEVFDSQSGIFCEVLGSS